MTKHPKATPAWAADVVDGLPSLLTTPEAAKALRVSVRTITRQIAAGHLAVVHIGTGVRIPRRAIADYLTTRGA